MEDKNKYIDQKLRELADYTPNVKADWEAFYSKNQSSIEVLQSGTGKIMVARLVASSGFKYTIIVISVIAVFVAAYLLTSNSKSRNNHEKKLPEIQVIRQNEIIVPVESSTPDKNPVEPVKKIFEPVDETNKNVILDSKIQKPDNATKLVDEVNQPKVPEVKETVKTGVNDSTTNKPVIIKKTVIIQDTIRIKRPVGK
jgi:hypothetical protein